jgi:prepilin-type N-terminal cleavage/methylation domain-containing protein
MTQKSLTRSTTRGTGHSGFTLIELAVVTLLIALFAGLTIPVLFGGGQRDLRATGRRISGMTRWCYNEAALSGREHRLVFDLERQVFFAQRLEADGELILLTGPGKERSPNGQVRLKDIDVAGRGRFSSETVAVRILPAGWLEETVVHLESEGEAQLTVRLMPLTGVSETYDGYREF